MAKIIEARAVISATDNTGAVFDKVAKKIDGLARTARTAKVVEDIARSIERAKKQMAAIDRFDLSRGALATSRQRFNETKLAVESAARAIAATAAPSREMEANFRRMQAAVAAASRAYEAQKNITISNKRALEGMGININEAAAHQNRLRAAVEKTNAALSHQGKLGNRNVRLWDHGGALGAGAAAAAGYVNAHGISHGISKTIAAGAHYQHEATGLVNVGRTPEEMAKVETASRKAVKAVPTSTYTENLKVISETTGAFGSLEHAIENLEFMQKAASVVHSAAGDKVQDGPGELGNKMARFFEMRGTAGDSHLFQSEAEKMVRAMIFTRGNFNPGEMINFGQQAKGALQNYDMDFLGSVAPSLITEMGGDRAGTAANAWRNVIMGKVRDKKQTGAWSALGLIDQNQVIGGKGDPLAWKAGAVDDTDLALRNPLEWTEKHLIPALQKKGVDTDDPLALSKELATMFRNQNANQFAEQITQRRARTRLHKDNALMGQVKPMDEIYSNNLKTDPTQAITSLTASLDNLATTVSSPAMQSAAGYISSLAGGLQTLANAAKEHPALAMAGGGLAAGGALAGSGYLSYKLLTGFGLSTSAAALDGSAAALTAAAAELTAAGAISKAVAGPAAAGAGGTVAGGLWTLGARALPFLGAAGVGLGIAGGIFAMHEATAQDSGTTSGERLRKYRGGSMADAYRNAFNSDRSRLGIPVVGDGGAAGAGIAGGVFAMHEATAQDRGTTAGERLRKYRGGSMADAYRNAFNSDRSRLGIPVVGDGGVKAELTGSAEVKGETTVKVEVVVRPSGELIEAAASAKGATAQMRGQFNSNGPGSTGRSSPDAIPGWTSPL